MTSKNRRSFLRAAWPGAEAGREIASLVVHAVPARIDEVTAAIGRIAEAEIAASDPRGKLVVAVEAPAGGRLGEILTELSLAPGVISATLVYHAAPGAEGMV